MELILSYIGTNKIKEKFSQVKRTNSEITCLIYDEIQNHLPVASTSVQKDINICGINIIDCIFCDYGFIIILIITHGVNINCPTYGTNRANAL